MVGLSILKLLCLGSMLLFGSQKKAATTGKSENAGASEGSDGDSAWDESSESDAEGALDLDELQETRPSPTSVFEDNQAKMTEKGAKGTTWFASHG